MITIMKASAGSGKTYNLAKKYIGLLLKNKDRYAYRHILAVTFTNKATDEMKSRILKELHVLASDPGSSRYLKDLVAELAVPEEELSTRAKDMLQDILHDYGSFAVSTIDRFFQQTLKAFSREIGHFASYQVELDKNSLVAESVDRILDSLTEEDGSLLSWLTDNVLEQIEHGERYNMDANLLDMALRLKSFQRQEAVEKYGLDEDDVHSKERLMEIRRSCREIISSFSNQVRTRARAALDVIESAGLDPSESNRSFLKNLYLYDGIEDRDVIVAPTETFLSNAADSDRWFAKSKAGKFLPLVYPALISPLNEFCSLWGADYQVYNTARILDDQIYGLGVAGELHRVYAELMKEKNVLSIDDSNTLLKNIIDGSDAPFIYEKIGVRFDHFLLDEFQDTARVQWSNFSPLLHNSDSQGGENLIVGDVKQSIYRWRGSDWSLLDETVPSEFPDFKVEKLNRNWRSRGNVVRFNNGFFKAAADILDGMNGTNSSGESMADIYADVEQDVANDSGQGGSVSLSFCPKEEQLQRVIDAVNEVRGAGARLSDIAVLVRSNAMGEEVASFLIDNGIPVITDDSLKVKGAITVRRIVSLMSFIDNPNDTVNRYLADLLDVSMPDSYSSLVDMAEALIRRIKEGDKDGIWRGEILHIQSFMDHLQDYVASKGNGLRGFLKYWENEDPSISSPSSGDSVRVMTIHKSKGLDFGYVIMPFAESITLFKAGDYWCAPDLEGTPLKGVADGVYDVTLSGASEATLFAGHYHKERFMQLVDNINTLYVAMTRPVLGMHIIAKAPSAKCKEALKKNDLTGFSDFSQILYWYVTGGDGLYDVRRSADECSERFDYGEIPDFEVSGESDDESVRSFEVSGEDGYPSFDLNPELIADDGQVLDVCERGRLKFTPDAADFFSADGDAGIAASNRIRGVVLHDILSGVKTASDISRAVADAAASGELSPNEAEEAASMLEARIAEVCELGWFSPDVRVLNERSIIDTDGEIYRPDRVVLKEGRVIIVDYKFGEHHRKYERQLAGYADLWSRMGYHDICSYLWYVDSGKVVKVG